MDGANSRKASRITLAAVAAAITGTAGAHQAEAAEAPLWETRFMEASGAELAAAARAIPKPPRTDTHVLFEERVDRFLPDGRRTSRERVVFRVLTRRGQRAWAELVADWEPWFEERPSMRARTVAANGGERVVAARSVAETPIERTDVYGDARRLSAALPGMAPGIIVETEIIRTQRRIPFASGWSYRFHFGGADPVLHARVSVAAPEQVPLRFVERRLPPGARVQVTATPAGETVQQWDAGPLPASPSPPPGSPPEGTVLPYVGYTTGTSWAAVAREYTAALERQTGQGVWSRLLAELTTNEAASRSELIAAVVDRMARAVRYTGIEFGESTLVPRSPELTLKLGFGDCKDQALLLVTLLRAVGIPAHVALLRAGAGADIDPELPGLAGFNHAIVVLPARPPVWIDPTDRFLPPGELPPPAQGRLALIASTATDSLVLTPTVAPDRNLLRERRELTLTEDGAVPRLSWLIESHGAIARLERAFVQGAGRERAVERLGRLARLRFGATSIIRHELSDPVDTSHPFRTVVDTTAPALVSRTDQGITVRLDAPLLELLPVWLATASDTALSTRAEDVVLELPYRHEITYRIVPPPGYIVAERPDSSDTAWGAAHRRTQVRLDEHGVVTVILTFETGGPRVSAADAAALLAGMRAALSQSVPIVRFARLPLRPTLDLRPQATSRD